MNKTRCMHKMFYNFACQLYLTPSFKMSASEKDSNWEKDNIYESIWLKINMQVKHIKISYIS